MGRLLLVARHACRRETRVETPLTLLPTALVAAVEQEQQAEMAEREAQVLAG